MKMRAIATLLGLLILGAGIAQAQVPVTVDESEILNGYMNVFDLPGDGGAFRFGSPWGFGDLTAVYSSGQLTLGPAPIGTFDDYWYTNLPCPGATGNKIMEANAYAEVIDGLEGKVINFSGVVVSNTLTDHLVYAFIKDWVGDFSSNVASIIPLTSPGSFSLSLETINDPTRVVQWGFQTVGVNVCPGTEGDYGTMVLDRDPAVTTENATWGTIKSLYR